MTQKYYKVETMKKWNQEWIDAQIEAEASYGMEDNHFFVKDGTVTQVVNCDQADSFYDFVKTMPEEVFEKMCDEFYKAIEDKDKVAMFRALTIFDEMDQHDLGTDAMKRRLMRVRKKTQKESYQF